MGVGSHSTLFHLLATLFGWLPRRCHSRDESQVVDPPDRSATFFSISYQIVFSGIISIDLTKNYVSNGEGTYCYRCIVQEQTPATIEIQINRLGRATTTIKSVKDLRCKIVKVVFLHQLLIPLIFKRPITNSFERCKRLILY